MNIVIDGKQCSAEYGEFILQVARRNNINIPTLCHNEALPGQGNCRLCVVEIIENKKNKIVASCIYPITHEIEVITNSESVINIRKEIIKLLAARAKNNEYINNLKIDYEISETGRYSVDINEECILCGLCVRACDAVGTNAISTVNRGVNKRVSTPYDEPALECIGCGACAEVCPTGAIKVTDSDGQRTIWNKEFNLIKCENCGRYFMTDQKKEYIIKKLKPDFSLKLCEKCRKEAAAENLKSVFENVCKY